MSAGNSQPSTKEIPDMIWVKDPNGPGYIGHTNPDFPAARAETEAEREARWRPIREREAAERKAELAAINALAHENGIGFESAKLLHKHRRPNAWMPDHESANYATRSKNASPRRRPSK